jgi:hypothetical protein
MKNIIIGFILGMSLSCYGFETSNDLTLKSEMHFLRSIDQLVAAVKIQKVKFTNPQAISCWNEAVREYKAGHADNDKAIKACEEEKRAWKDMAEQLSK